ncbi:hypothetical protein DPMN_118744 [Dreissena polymorpha]|uniref:Uncharacterized protein n=1 Tax=Dreissena polymorpha TaxID=45954 RepID=A0A9D4GHZ5_DREPO|nr:hypothetical protein DPMN_118744 [Dreissena polymorpha]
MMNVISAPPSTFEMEKFWKLESMGISSESTDGTSGNLQEYMSNNISFEDGRYVAKLP